MHILISIPPNYAVSRVVGYIKGKSAVHLARTYGERKQNYVGQHFRARGYLVSTVGRDEAVIRDYIRNQKTEDDRLDQLNLWKRPATDMGAQLNRGRVSVSAQSALSGSHRKASGLAGRSIFLYRRTLSSPPSRRFFRRFADYFPSSTHNPTLGGFILNSGRSRMRIVGRKPPVGPALRDRQDAGMKRRI